ncbi:uncharacterized protein LOC121372310 isoform X2 [Gigantopelta aegis]|uniref:uncharacterized protein LOC121372310 isoform X2 n=1 Tax=Gigantopelta aegis TaxID=1735272 RepID=UPI001B88D507|nr:uncharacterized protein LOC121372310 isoform X2 [Gigantopelta aegis]
MGDRGQTEAFVTLATNDTYALGCLVLANSLRHVHTTRRIVIMVTSGVSESTRNQLSRMFDEIVEVDVLDSRDAVNLQLLGRPDLSVTFTKLHCWRLTQFNKCVFMDADTMVIQNVDELFDREELSASPDAGWPDCFNSGVFVFRPNEETYRSLIQFAMTIGTFDGGDQGLLNLYFHEWATKDINKHLPFTYNVVSQAFYSYLPAFTQFRDNIKIVHFIGAVKPWHHPYDMKTGNVMPLSGSGHSQEFLQMWWSIFMECVQPSLDPALTPLRLVQLQPLARPDPNLTEHESAFLSTNLHNHEPTYQVVFPYVPPQLDKVFYSPLLLNRNDNHLEKGISNIVIESFDELKIVTPKVISISQQPVTTYLCFETHYPEEPLSLIDPETDLSDIYLASILEYEMNVKKNANGQITKSSAVISKKPEEKVGPQKDSGKNLPNTGSSEKKCVPVKSKVQKQGEDYLHKGASGSNGIDVPTATDQQRAKTRTQYPTSCGKTPTSVGGLVGQLAGMQVQADEEGAQQEGIIVLDDQERKLAWERGQMDYLGADSFQNIQKKLDKAMAEPVSPKLHKSPKLPTSPAPEEPLEEKLEKPAKNSKEAPKKAKSPPVFSGK